MARVTVEDCIERIPNRFELVLTASQRARAIQKGELLTIDRDNDKNPVVALREIADETIDLDKVQQALVRSMQRFSEQPEVSEQSDEAHLIAEEDLSNMVGMEMEQDFDDAGMQVGTGSELETSGFEDVDTASLDAEM